jgi:hypothetical protein
MLGRISRLEWFGVWLTFIGWGLLLLVRPGGAPAGWGPYLWIVVAALLGFSLGQVSARAWRPGPARRESIVATATGLLGVSASLVANLIGGAEWAFRAMGLVDLVGGLIGVISTLTWPAAS